MLLVPRPDAGVLAVALPDEDVLLLHENSRQYFALNETGSLIWKMIEGAAAFEEIVQALCDRFDVGPEEAAAAITELLQELRENRLVTQGGMRAEP